MEVTVYGAGAIGGTTGAALARAGHDVRLVDSHAPHVEAINAHGLTIEREGTATTTRIRAVLPADLGKDLPLILLAVMPFYATTILSAWAVTMLSEKSFQIGQGMMVGFTP